ncbi:MAG: cytochrome c [Gammaproteobacteria bacterium]|jgi:mono/diheme cytochrome c family protein
MFAVMILALSIGTAANAESGDSPSFAYLLHCAGCHLENGAGDPPDIPDLREELGLLLTVPEGRHYALRVPGVTDAQVSDEQMAALMTWLVNRLYPEKEGFEPFTAAEVIAGRENRLSDPVRYRNELLIELTGTAEQPKGAVD